MHVEDTKFAGSAWLKRYYRLDAFELSHRSLIGSTNKTVVTLNGTVEQAYGPKYAPVVETPIAHWEFALKYDHVDLAFFKAVLARMEADDILAYIQAAPNSKYTRKTGFFYEFLLQMVLPVTTIGGNYIDLLDASDYIVGPVRREAKWRINNNLLGNRDFCPVVRRSRELDTLLALDIGVEIANLKGNYPPETLVRAITYLYTKETRSSYEIEHEKPSPKRTERFIALLQQAGRVDATDFLTEQALTRWQNAIVDARYAAAGFRDFQNYIGQTLPNYIEHVHYICPPPQFVASLMQGVAQLAKDNIGVPPMVRAALVAFGFVFIHPFEDGNGRLHRFLIHDMLVRDGVVQDQMILPISAHILSHIKEYDAVLEAYSKPLMKLIDFTQDGRGEITVKNPTEVEGYFRFPDLTKQVVYLAQTIKDTVFEDLPTELRFIQRYDELKREIQEIVDMPDKSINLMILFLHQNNGVFPKRRRQLFEELTDDEIKAMEASYRMVFS